jgi:type IV pilus assembly protein PilO
MKFSEIQNLDPGNIGAWPTPAKAGAILILCALVVGAAVYFDTQGQQTELETNIRKESELKAKFELLQQKSANLQPLTRQMKEMEQSFGALLRLLPNKTEIEGLLVDISKSGLASGLEFDLFKPEDEEPAEFYAIQPINIQVTGTYHDFGQFISAVAALPRIVTVHDIHIRPIARPNTATQLQEDKVALTMSIVAKTYRYLDDGEG